jgi:hypothetical protein
MQKGKLEDPHSHNLRQTSNDPFVYNAPDPTAKCNSRPTQGRNAPGPTRKMPTSSNSCKSMARRNGPPSAKIYPVTPA